MKRLSNEVIDLIAEELDGIDQKQFRLVCRGFGSSKAQSARSLFRELHFYCHQDSFKVVQAVAATTSVPESRIISSRMDGAKLGKPVPLISCRIPKKPSGIENLASAMEFQNQQHDQLHQYPKLASHHNVHRK